MIFFRTRIIQIARMSPVGSAACVLCLKFNQYSVDSSHSCSFKHNLVFLKTQTADFFRTRIIQIARMSPMGSAAWVLCLKFNQYSVDSSHSCSFKHNLVFLKTQTADFFRTRIIQIARMSPMGSAAWVLCLKFNQYSVDSSHSCSFKTQVLRVPFKP